MPPTTNLHQPSRKFPSFLPKNFYEAPRYASYAPAPLASIPSSAPAVVAEVVAPTKRRGRPAIFHPNSLKPYLERYNSPGYALAKLPHLDNIVSGMVRLNFGENMTPFSKKAHDRPVTASGRNLDSKRRRVYGALLTGMLSTARSKNRILPARHRTYCREASAACMVEVTAV
jgi:hypothetical protein